MQPEIDPWVARPGRPEGADHLGAASSVVPGASRRTGEAIGGLGKSAEYGGAEDCAGGSCNCMIYSFLSLDIELIRRFLALVWLCVIQLRKHFRASTRVICYGSKWRDFVPRSGSVLLRSAIVNFPNCVSLELKLVRTDIACSYVKLTYTGEQPHDYSHWILGTNINPEALI